MLDGGVAGDEGEAGVGGDDPVGGAVGAVGDLEGDGGDGWPLRRLELA